MSKQGFTLVELVIVIIIVGILSIVAVPIYRSYTLKAIGTEGKALMGAIASAQQVHYTEYGNFQALTKTATDKKFGVDAKANKFFREFTITTSGSGEGSYKWDAMAFGDANTKAAGMTVRMQSADTGNNGDTYMNVYDDSGAVIENIVMY